MSHRGYCDGFLFDPPAGEGHRYEDGGYLQGYDFVAVAVAYDRERKWLEVEQRNRFAVGEELEWLTPQGSGSSWVLAEIFDGEGHCLNAAAHPQMRVFLPVKEEIAPLSILRRRKK